MFATFWFISMLNRKYCDSLYDFSVKSGKMRDWLRFVGFYPPIR